MQVWKMGTTVDLANSGGVKGMIIGVHLRQTSGARYDTLYEVAWWSEGKRYDQWMTEPEFTVSAQDQQRTEEIEFK